MAPRHVIAGASAPAPAAFDLSATVGQRVVRLPTAASRKVQQGGNRAWREAREALRAQTPWKGEYIFPSIRDCMNRLDALRQMETTEARYARDALDAPSGDEARRVFRMLEAARDGGDPTASAALALILSVTGTTHGQLNDYAWARAAMADEALRGLR